MSIPRLDYAPPPSRRERVGGMFAFERRGSASIAGAYRSLATQLDAGLDVRRATDTIARQHDSSTTFGRAMGHVRDRVGEGDTLAEAMRDYSDVFGESDVRAVEAAERAGVLEESLNRLAAGREATQRLRKRAVSALMYPAFVVGFAIVVTTLLFAFVVPTILGPILADGRTPPLPTRIVAGLSWTITRLGWAIALLAIVAFFIAKRLLRVEGNRRVVDDAVLHVPVIGPMLHKHATAQAATLLSTCVRCGLNLIESLDLTARAATNRAVGASIARWRDNVQRGDEPDEALRRAGGLPPLALEMVSVGATTGTLDKSLAKLAEVYENDVDETAKRLGALVEPAIVIFLGGVVLLIALAVLLPILQLGDVFGG